MKIYTVGHSTRTQQEFVDILKSFGIEILADVRSMPGSRYLPHFNKENMSLWIEEAGIEYIHMPVLGGRRRKLPDIDTALTEGWKHIAFRNYSAYALTEEYRAGLDGLIKTAKDGLTCIMCAESVPWKCHRLLISNNLIAAGVTVYHIMDKDKAIAHELNRFGAAAVLQGSKVIYPKQ